jgi:hypothetical protein
MRHRFVRALSFVIRFVISVILKIAITVGVFAISLVIASHYFGVRVGSIPELMDAFEGLARFAEILS